MACLGLSTSQAALLSFQPLKASECCVGRKFGVYRDSQTTRSNSAIRVKPGVSQRKGSVTRASLAGNSHIASTIFTAGTTIVIPFYTLMVFAPHSRLTKRAMESKIPYIVLGALYAYLLYQSWTPETLHLMFASKYWLPELPGITRMFSTELTVASAWLHLLAVDLFAARQVFHDGLKENIETRHSIILCLLFCPIGIMTHMVTKALTMLWRTFRGIKGTMNQLSTISND